MDLLNIRMFVTLPPKRNRREFDAEGFLENKYFS